MKLLSFGEILWDVYPDKAIIGGAPLNFAAHFARLGGESKMLSALGSDELGNAALSELERRNIGTEYVALSCRQTGKCLVTLDCNRIPSYNLLEDVAYDYIGGDIKEKFDVLYFGTLALRSSHNRASLERLIRKNTFKEIFCDVNIRPPFYSAESIEFCLENATILKLSDEELPTVLRQVFSAEYDYKIAAQKIAERYKNIKTVIITLGEKGSYAYNTADGRGYPHKSEKVEVVSTVGAGDSFSAAFLYKYLSGGDIEVCLSAATRLSAFVVSRLEAIPEYDPALIGVK